ncbi:DUF1214 domain-containing protein [Flavobacterium sp. KACC 22761]|uniref:DUF1214 domain-containing protein n=1 Tax=Flavobacterium sp. KACC 22761 TaxID=3092665 RepID=UPI002A7483C1|nr:DUF1214 domain-containing protein [Flavobacterium sp. KACC 22761]WPO79350.1 DUF1214 domain-containing protein [Flavobacterium sp. KACC 22761]
MKIKQKLSAGIFLLVISFLAFACKKNSTTDSESTKKDSIQTTTDSLASKKGDLVTAANFNRAETDLYFNTSVKQSNGIGAIFHYRTLMPIDNQSVIRANRDVLYSSGVFDLDAGPITVTLPNPGKRFMSMQTIDQDQYSETYYAPGTFTFTKEKVGTRYLMLGIRTFINPNDPKDLPIVTALQNAIKVDQKEKGTFEIPNWDKASQKKVRDSLIEVSKKLADTKGMFGPRGKVDETLHLIGSATGWGGNPEKDAFYLSVNPPKNDGKTIYKLKVKNVPVDGFWSVSVYNKEGYFEKNDLNIYSLNNITAKKDADGSVTIQFGGCDGKTPNCIPTVAGWNYWVRLYRPHKEVLNGTWKFPEAQIIK